MADRDLLFRFLGDNRDLARASRDARRDLDDTNQSAGRLERGIGGTRKAVVGFAGAIAAAGVGQFAFDAAMAAESAERAAESAGQVLGPELEGLRDDVQGVREQLGLSQADFDALAAKLGLMTESLTDAQQAEFIEWLVNAGGDLAAFNGRIGEGEEAIDSLTAVMRGEFDSLEQWGVKISAAEIETRKLELATDDANTSLSEQELEILAVQSLIDEKMAPAVGALAGEEDTLASKVNEAKAKYEDLKATLGEKLIPLFLGFLEFLENAGEAWGRLVNDFWNTRLGAAIAKLRPPFDAFMALIQSIIDGLIRMKELMGLGVNLPTIKKGGTVPGFGKPGFGPDTPHMATGGKVPGPRGAAVPIVAHGGEHIMPADASMAAPINITIEAGVGDPQAIARAVVDVLQTYNQTNGAIPITVRDTA